MKAQKTKTRTRKPKIDHIVSVKHTFKTWEEARDFMNTLPEEASVTYSAKLVGT